MDFAVKSQTRLKDRRGFSLLEAMITLSVFLIVLLGIYQLYETNRTTFGRGEVRTDIQQNARMALSVIERDLRMAGYGVPAPTCVAATTRISNAQAQQVTLRADIRNVSTTLTAAAAAAATTLTVNNTAGIVGGDVLYIFDGAVCETTKTVSTVDSATSLTLNAGLTNAFGIGTRVYTPKDITFSFVAGGLRRDARNAGAGAAGDPPVLADRVVVGNIFEYFDVNNNAIAAPVADPTLIRRITIQLSASGTPTGLNAQTYTLNSDVRPRNL
jgi:prepilin-type N-terminal cleavage/methylation domain-containing protein